MPNPRDEDKREFLADASSFANAAGGHIVFGIDAVDGVPRALPGLDSVNADEEISRLENLLRDGVEPRMLSARFSPPIPMTSGRVAIVLRVPRSWVGAHRVTLRGHGHFYTRNSNSKYQMNVGELRAAFLISETAAERLRTFRAERIAQVAAGDTPARLVHKAAVLLHLVPFSGVTLDARHDVTNLDQQPYLPNTTPLQPQGGFLDYYLNFDGFLSAYRVQETGQAVAYTQVFRTGAVEAAAVHIVEGIGQEQIPAGTFEESLINGAARYLTLLRTLGVEPPIALMLSLVGVRGYRMAAASSPMDLLRPPQPIDRDILPVPETIITEYGDAARLLKPSLDIIWNAVGRSGSPYFSAEGAWVDPQR